MEPSGGRAMEVERRRTLRYALLTVSLAAMAGMLAWMCALTLRASGGDAGETARLLSTLAVASVGLLGLTLIALLGVVLRWIRTSIGLHKPLPPSHYVDAWAEAGKRIQAPPDEDDEYDESE
jgi:hypothetical protein